MSGTHNNKPEATAREKV